MSSADFPRASNHRSIPSLDGMRALSILLVILAHGRWWFQGLSETIYFSRRLLVGSKGVGVFFVISGYLITSLLRREFEQTGNVSLKKFYFRRSMRIFPPFYFLLAVMAVLWGVGWVPEHWRDFLAAFTYTGALFPHWRDYFLAHSWSLSIEELFYLFWPFAFLAGHARRKVIHVAITLVLLMPLIRLVMHFVAPGLRGYERYMVQGWVDTMMVGCLLALIRGDAKWERFNKRYLKSLTAMGLFVVGFIGMPLLQGALPRALEGLFSLMVEPVVFALCVGGILVYVVEHPRCLAGRLLNNPVVRHCGVLSYSLYLWQQIFTSDIIPMLPYGFLYTLGAAEFSFWIVERRSSRLRSRLEQSMWPGQKNTQIHLDRKEAAIARSNPVR